MLVHVVTEELKYDGSTTRGVFSDRDAADAYAATLRDAATPSERTYTGWWVETFTLDVPSQD